MTKKDLPISRPNPADGILVLQLPPGLKQQIIKASTAVSLSATEWLIQLAQKNLTQKKDEDEIS